LKASFLPPVGIAICTRSFSGHVIDDTNRPDWIINATHDAWFGNSDGPWQHLAPTRMRAIEEGLPIVRAAHIGISAVIDAHRRILAKLDLTETGILDAQLFPALPLIPYGWSGDFHITPPHHVSDTDSCSAGTAAQTH